MSSLSKYSMLKLNSLIRAEEKMVKYGKIKINGTGVIEVVIFGNINRGLIGQIISEHICKNTDYNSTDEEY